MTSFQRPNTWLCTIKNVVMIIFWNYVETVVQLFLRFLFIPKSCVISTLFHKNTYTHTYSLSTVSLWICSKTLVLLFLTWKKGITGILQVFSLVYNPIFKDIFKVFHLYLLYKRLMLRFLIFDHYLSTLFTFCWMVNRSFER